MIQRTLLCLAAFAAVYLVGCGDGDSKSTPIVATGGSGGDASLEASSDAAGSGGGTDAKLPDANDSATPSDAQDSATPSDAQDSTTPSDAQEGSIQADATDSGGSCGRVPGPVDADRFVVVSYPYDGDASKAETYGLMKLTASGTLTNTSEMFSMGRGLMGDAIFTPDGKVGIVVQDDGTLGVFRVDAAGKVEVVHAKFKGGFYAGRLVMHPSGDRVYVLDSEWANIGGGVYSVRIGCDGQLTDEGRIVEAKLPYSMIPIPGKPGEVALASKDVLGCAAGDDVHLLTIEPQISRAASADPFADDEQIIASGAATPDGKYVLFGDNSELSAFGNRLAVLEVGDKTLTTRQVIADVEDPIALVASPFADVAIVVSGYGNSIKVLNYDAANGSAPFSIKGALSYQGAKPQLPSCAVMIERGQLKGRVLVGEVEGVRMVQFTGQSDGVKDLGLTSTGGGMDKLPGVVGVQP